MTYISGSAGSQPATGTPDTVDLTKVGGVEVTLGQKTGADSIPVVFASDQTLTVTADGSFTPADNHPEDAGHISGETGSFILGVRNDAAAARTSADGDYSPVSVDSAGRIGVSDLGGSVTVDGTVELGATTLSALESTTVQNGSGASAVNIQDGGNSITVDGTVTANAGTGTFVVGDGGGSLTVDGTIAATQSGTWTEANSAAIKTSVEIMDDWDESDRAKVNIIAGQVGVDGGAGVTTSATVRVIPATDDFTTFSLGTIVTGGSQTTAGIDVAGYGHVTFTVATNGSVSGGVFVIQGSYDNSTFTLSPSTSANTVSQLFTGGQSVGASNTSQVEYPISSRYARVSFSTPLAGVGGVATITAVAFRAPSKHVAVTQATSPWVVSGAASSGAAKSGAPVQVGGVFNTTQPTVTTGQAVEAQATNRGALIVATGVDAFTASVTGSVEITNDVGNPIPVNGTVAATQSGTWNVGTVSTITNVVHVDDNAGSLTVDGTVGISGTVAVTQSTSPWVVSGNVTATPTGTQDVNVVSTVEVEIKNDTGNPIPVNGTVAATQSGTWTEANSAAIKTAVEVMDDWDESDRAKVNPIVGQAGVEADTGVITTKTQRVTLATDDVASTSMTKIVNRTQKIAESPKPKLIDTNLVQKQIIQASDPTSNTRFSSATGYLRHASADGSTVAIPANNKASNTGAVYIFTRTAPGSLFTQQQKLTASDAAINQQFGSGVSMSADGNVVVIGAFRDDNTNGTDAGAVYVFKRVGTTWTEFQKIISPVTGEALYGQSAYISRDGSYLYVSDPAADVGANTAQGVIWLYRRDITTGFYTLDSGEEFIDDDGHAGDMFGLTSVSDSGNVVICESLENHGSYTNSGAAIIFTRDNEYAAWSQQKVYTDPRYEADSDYFGYPAAVSHDDQTIIIGSNNEDNENGGDAGALYIFERDDTGQYQFNRRIIQEANANATSPGTVNAYFGGTVWFTRDGLTFITGDAYGFLDVYSKVDSTWLRTSRIDKAAPATEFSYGILLCEDDRTLFVGAVNDDTGATDAGVVYYYDLIRKFDSSGSVNVIEGAITPKHVTANTTGETTIITPTSGNAIRLWWYNIAADPANTGHVTIGLRFGTGNTDFYKVGLSQYGAATAHSFKSGKSFHQGAVDQPLLINLSGNQTTYVNIDYEEVTP